MRRAEAFGWRAIEIDVHDFDGIDGACEQTLAGDGQPVAIIARTVKGNGVSSVENRNGFHGKPLPDPEAAIRELGGLRDLTVASERSERRCKVAPVRDRGGGNGELASRRGKPVVVGIADGAD